MNKVDLILETILFTKNKFRGLLAAFLQDCLSRDFHIQVELNNLPCAVIFNDNNVLREEISLRIREAKPNIGFEHDTNDKLLQNLIFLFLVFSINEYPSNDEWESFLNQTHDVKRNIIMTGIKKIWMSYQEEIIENNLNNDTIVDNLPF
jgi:hypothetical protein